MRIRLFSATLLASTIATAATPIDGWYSSVFGGYTYMPHNISNTTYGLFRNSPSYEPGYNVGGRLGYQSNPLRYEVEYTYLQATADNFDLDYIAQTGVTGYASGNFAMANVYYDAPEMLPAVSPFIGAGIGYAFIQATLSSLGPQAVTYYSTNDNVFAYQGTLGLTYNFAENYALNVAYRYTATNKPDGFGEVFQAHMASVGVVYHFDRLSYK